MESPPRNAVSGTVLDQSCQTSLESLLVKKSRRIQEREAGSLADELMLELLEFDRLRKALAKYAYSKRGQSLALSLCPSQDLEVSRQRLRELLAAKRVIEDHGFWPEAPRDDIALPLERAEQRHRLSLADLLAIAELLSVTGRTREYWNAIEDIPEALLRYARAVGPIAGLAERIERSVESEDRLRDQASPQLKKVREHFLYSAYIFKHRSPISECSSIVST